MTNARPDRRPAILVEDDPDYCAFLPVLRLAARDCDMSPQAYARLLIVQGLLRRGYLDETDITE